MRAEGGDGDRASVVERLGALHQRASCLHHVIDDEHVLARALAVLDHDGPLVTHALLATRDDLVFREERAEALLSALVGEGDHVDPRLRPREHLLHQRHRRVHRRDRTRVQVEPVLQSVQVVKHHAGRAAGVRQAGEHAADGVCGGDLAFHSDPLHRCRRQVGQEDGERRDERLAQHHERVELRQDRVIRVEVGEEEDVRAHDDVHGGESTEDDVIHPRVVELAPLRGVEAEGRRVLRHEPLRELLKRRVCQDDVFGGAETLRR
mmetsp:Transcript_11626/g.30284  ORF Transcript_11626/g.30284 Transcript_11626/m.30284 type:complete len:264 (-) Transcript_11626:140-931(-)